MKYRGVILLVLIAFALSLMGCNLLKLADGAEESTPEAVVVEEVTEEAPVQPLKPREGGLTPIPAGGEVVSPGNSDDLGADMTLTYSEDFEGSADDWIFDRDDTEYGIIGYDLVDGMYVWDIEAKQDMVWWVYKDGDYQDLTLATRGVFLEGTEDIAYGLLFRHYDTDNFTIVEISNLYQKYGVYKMVAGEWVTLTDWTYSDAIHVDEANDLRVVASGNAIQVYINGQFVDQVMDDAEPLTGQTGFIMELFNAGDRVKFGFDYFEVYEP